MSDIITPPAEALVAVVESIDIAPGIVFRGELWAPKNLGQLPVGVVGGPLVRRIAPEEAESQLHTDDWFAEYPVDLYFDLDKAQRNQAHAVAALVQFIAAIDADETLGGTVYDCGVTEAKPFVEVPDAQNDKVSRPLLGYQIVVSTYQLVTSTP